MCKLDKPDCFNCPYPDCTASAHDIQRQWKNGYKVYTTDVVIDEIEFGDSKANNDSATQEARAKDHEVEKKAIDEEFMTVSDEDLEGLPFN